MRTKVLFISLTVFSVFSLFSQNIYVFVGGQYGYGGSHVNQGFNQLTGIQLGYAVPVSGVFKIGFNYFIPFNYGFGEGYQHNDSYDPEYYEGGVTASGYALMIGYGLRYPLPESKVFVTGGLNLVLQQLENRIGASTKGSAFGIHTTDEYMTSVFHLNPELAIGYRIEAAPRLSLDLKVGYTASLISVSVAEMIGFGENDPTFRYDFAFASLTVNFMR